MKVVVTSTANQKVEAVTKAFKNVLPGKSINVIGFKAPSSVNEQPVGKDEMEIGANNRLAESLKNQEGDVFVSMENGIHYLNSQWQDFAFVLIYIPIYRATFQGFTACVVFPSDCVEEANRRGFDLHTVGSLMAELRPDIDKQDPHLSLTGKSRVVYLQETIELLLNQANSQHLFQRL